MSSACIINGDCVDAVRNMPAGRVDFILTDPPYITNFQTATAARSRAMTTPHWLEASYTQMHRVLKDAFAVTCYGWHKVNLFAAV